MAAAKASRSPWSASDSFILRTRMKRPGISSRLAMACFASSISQGKYWAALISRVTAKSSLKVMRSALAPSTVRRYVALADERAGVPLRDQPLQVVQVGRICARPAGVSRLGSLRASAALALISSGVPYFATTSSRSLTTCVSGSSRTALMAASRSGRDAQRALASASSSRRAHGSSLLLVLSCASQPDAPARRTPHP